MKPARLYTKIFLSFLGVLVLTELLTLLLFIKSAGSTFRERYYRYAQANVLVDQRFITDHLAALPPDRALPSPQADQVLAFIGQAHGAQLWIEDEKGRMLAKSSPGLQLPSPKLSWHKSKKLGHGIVMRHGYRRGFNLYLTGPFALPDGRRVVLHVLLSESEPLDHLAGFILGLLAIGGVVALLVIPISRLITRPVGRLEASALRIAQGDLTHRARLAGKDEIAELARSFNHMADRLAAMVRQGRELTAHLSHELRSPLARIRVAQQMLSDRLESSQDPALARHLESIRLEIEDMDHLIGRMLELSKLDLSPEPPRREPLIVADLLEGLLERFRPGLEQKGLSPRPHLDPEMVVRGDPEALGSALANLLENALKYTPQGGWVAVDLKKAGDQVLIQVANSAPPLSTQALENIFQPFVRGDKASEGGYGLGLAISRRIIEQHGGALTAANQAQGPVFTVTLPGVASR